MKRASTFALAASVLASSLYLAAPVTPALSQKGKAKEAAAAPERKFDTSKEARKALGELQAAVQAKDNANFAARLAAAEAVAKTVDDKYLIGKFRLQQALDTKDAAAQNAAAEAILASGGADATETAALQAHLANAAINSGDFARAEAYYGGRVTAVPTDLDAVVNLARVKLELNKQREALDLLQRAISLSKTAGKQPEESWYRKSLEIAHAEKNGPLAMQMARDVLALYPSEVNLRNAVVVFRDSATLDKEADLDLLRLMRATKVMSGPGGYIELAQLLNEAGLPGEAKAVLEEGTRLGVLKGGSGASLLATVNARATEDRASLPGVDAKARTAANGTLAMRTATAYLGYGDYGRAVELFRVALAKGGVDANLVNTRLGMALALSGQKAEAATAFQGVTGPRADLAALWLSWMNQRS